VLASAGHAGCTRILAKSGIADMKKLSVPLETLIIFVFNFKVKLTRQQSKMSRIHSNNKIAIVTPGGDEGNGHNGLS
jgi:hypothetical protein